MRLKSSLFVSALMRSESLNGSFCAIVRKGAEEAGAIFIVHNKGLNLSDLYGPAPQMFLEDINPSERFFELLHKELSELEVSEKLDKQINFDPDCWVIELEKRDQLISINII